MAQELSQEALLDFLCQAGGRVTNAALLNHFKRFLRDPKAPPSQHQHHRELFKGFVNSVAAVRQDPDGTKYVVLKRRYRDLLGEEGLQRPCDLPAAAAPAGGAAPGFPGGARTGKPKPQPRRRRDKEREEEPAGAAAPVTNARCNGLPASGAREAVPGGDWQLVSFGQRSPGQEAAQAGVRCAAAETQGRVCWECQQNSLSERPGGSHQGKLPDPANTREKPARTQPAQDDRESPAELLEGVHPEPTREPAASPLPSATAEAARSKVSPPALRSGPSSPGDRLELLALGSSHISILQQQQQQQQRTVEWVARHPLMPEDQGPIRTWSVLPEDFHQLSLEPDFCVPQTNPAPPGPPLPSHSVFPVIPNEFSESSSRDPPLTVFRSIRCQLSLQDLDDFVDEESHGSEESSSGPKDSPGASEDGLQVAVRSPVWENLRSPAQGVSVSPNKAYTSRSPQGLRNREDGHNCRHAIGEANGIAGHYQESLPSSALKSRRSLRRSSRAGRPKLSSSDDELLGEDLLQRGRRPLRSRKPSKAGAVPSPRVDASLTTKRLGIKAVAERGQPHSSWTPCRDGSAALSGHRPEHKSSLVPLDAREHEWIVKLASGSWIRVLSLFWEEPQLALHRDFLTGYTALHWMAKHGSIRALQDLVSGAQKAGIALDVNVRSSCGYTPLHLAAIHGHQGVIKLLVQRLSSQVNIRDSSGKKPWQYLTSNTSGEIWQLLGAPRGKPIFPVYPLVHSSSPTRKAKSRELSRTITRKTSFAALLKGQHSKRKLANQYEKFHTLREREEYSD